MFLYEGVSYPPEMKYVIVLFTRWDPEGDRRRDTALGGMDNRVCASRENFMVSALPKYGLDSRQRKDRAAESN